MSLRPEAAWWSAVEGGRSRSLLEQMTLHAERDTLDTSEHTLPGPAAESAELFSGDVKLRHDRPK